MDPLTNIYCDESCHLEHDHQTVMVLGAVVCAGGKTREVAQRIREIKERHGLRPDFEVKWTKVSPSKLEFFRDLVDYFFDDDDIGFRTLIAEKGKLRHDDFGQTHDEWYYKMYFTLLKALLGPGHRFHIYIQPLLQRLPAQQTCLCGKDVADEALSDASGKGGYVLAHHLRRPVGGRPAS